MSSDSRRTFSPNNKKLGPPPQTLVARYDAACRANDREKITAARLLIEKMLARIVHKTISLKKAEMRRAEIAENVLARLRNALDDTNSADWQNLRKGTYRTAKARTIDTIRDLEKRPGFDPFDPELHDTQDSLARLGNYGFLTEAEARQDALRFIATLTSQELAELTKAIDGIPAGSRQATRLRARIEKKADEFYGNSRSFQVSLGDMLVPTDPLTGLTRFDIAMMAFEIGCPNATDEDVVQWSKTYPEFSYDFAAHAAVQHGDLDFFELAPEEQSEFEKSVMKSMARFIEHRMKMRPPLNA